VGSGLYGILVLAIMTVFVAGLMVGRTPEYLRKRITGREIKLVSLYILTMPLVVLVGTGIAMVVRHATGRRCSAPDRTVCPRCCTRSCRPPTTTVRRSPG
jgi:K+-transporting ATPase A subunit